MKPDQLTSSNSIQFATDTRPVLITGGSGFIGTNLADRLLSNGQPVIIFDNFSRSGVDRNFEWLSKKHGSLIDLQLADVRNANAVRAAVRSASTVFHFAAQVAVTSSITDPEQDFAVNAMGTLNVLEAVRNATHPIPIFFTSTNKVYGALNDVALTESDTRYEPISPYLSRAGINEHRPMDFHSPYGCSKGTADQYVIDYGRTYKIPTVVFRMSCIYGPHQYGTEDQGWIAHFMIRAMQGKPLTVYGNGKQVRDILYIEDLVNAFLLAHQNVEALAARAFNMGGGISNTISLIEFIRKIETMQECKIEILRDRWRQGDQRYFVSNTTLFRKATGWRPLVSLDQGLRNIDQWLKENTKPTLIPHPTSVGYEIRSY